MTYNQIVDHYGGLSKAAQALGLKKQRIHAWKRIRVPTLWQLRISDDTGLRADKQAISEAMVMASYARKQGARSAR